MISPRQSGILLHPTSLPSPFGIGDLGPAAYRFVDWLARAGQSLWQVLPLGPTGYADSPYQCFSSFAGNPLLVSPEWLRGAGLLTQAELDAVPALPADRVDYGPVIEVKNALLRKAFGRFAGGQEYAAFCQANAAWLDDYALFAALKQAHNLAPWTTWESDLVQRVPAALTRERERLSREMEFVKFVQFNFFAQWDALHRYARERDIRIIGDVPIFVAHDSADVWSHPELFYLCADGQPSMVAGVPPDYFSETGQLWGNPLYRWGLMAKQDYAWWIARMRAVLRLVDIVRLDHFRGFEAYWAIPWPAETAIHGTWEPGPGAAFLYALEEALGSPLPIIAEDLGIITKAVVALRTTFQLPGMRVLQFAFTADTLSTFLPHSYEPHTVAYTGTHDNDTTTGWFEKLEPPIRKQVLDYTGTDGKHISMDIIRLLLMSVADTVVFPLQDVLGVDGSGRMNLPGTTGGNWTWRYDVASLTDKLADDLATMVVAYERKPR